MDSQQVSAAAPPAATVAFPKTPLAALSTFNNALFMRLVKNVSSEERAAIAAARVAAGTVPTPPLD